MSNLTILSIKYEEFTWLKTRECIEATGLPVVFVDRNPKGCGSLSEAINRGMKEVKTPYVFLVTNIEFKPHVPNTLLKSILENPDYIAICPVYNSDHRHLQPSSYLYQSELKEVPFIEFTAGIFESEWLCEFPLDEDMPYVGMDLDWSYQARKMGYKLGSLKSCEIEHTYIRKMNGLPITKKRLKLRKQADAGTIAKLEMKYGKEWRHVLGYYNGIASK